MTAEATTWPASWPTSGPGTLGAVDDPMLMAQLDLATEWRFWCLLTHRDGRVFAGRAGALRIFGTVMVRVDVPIGAATVTYGLHPDQLADWLVCSEGEARTVAAIVGLPERPVAPGVIDRALGQGGAA